MIDDFNSLGSVLQKCDSETAADCVFVVRVLLDNGIEGIVDRFSVSSLERAYKFLCGRSLDYDFKRFRSFNHGS